VAAVGGVTRRLTDREERAEVGARIRRAREAAGYSNADFARLLGVQPSQITSWEKGEAAPNSPRKWGLLVDALDVTCDYLLLGKTNGLSREAYSKLSMQLAEKPVGER
jgi:transcriptional regulator with XRE-family HTH domain